MLNEVGRALPATALLSLATVSAPRDRLTERGEDKLCWKHWVRAGEDMESAAGYLEVDGRFLHFADASVSFHRGSLFINGRGKNCRIALVGVPFPGVETVAELPGKSWEPDENGLARAADVFAEGGVEILGYQLRVYSATVSCRYYNPQTRTLSVAFQLKGEDSEYGGTKEVDGMIRGKEKG